MNKGIFYDDLAGYVSLHNEQGFVWLDCTGDECFYSEYEGTPTIRISPKELAEWND